MVNTKPSKRGRKSKRKGRKTRNKKTVRRR